MTNRKSNREDGNPSQAQDDPPQFENVLSESESKYKETDEGIVMDEGNSIEPEKSKKQAKGNNTTRATGKLKGKLKDPCPKCDKNCTSGSIHCRV